MLYRGTKLRLYALAAGVVLACTYGVPLDVRISERHAPATLWGTSDDLAGATVEFHDGMRLDSPSVLFLGFAFCETRTTLLARWIPDWVILDCVGVRRMHVVIQTPLTHADAVAVDTIETKVRAAVENGVPDFHMRSGLESDRGFATLQLPDADGLLVVHWPALLVSAVRVIAFIVLVVALAKIIAARRRGIAGERCPRCDYALPYCDENGCPECGWHRRGAEVVMR